MKTEELIRLSVKQAEDGEATSKHVSEKLGEIADIVAEIASAAKEQAAGIEQVTRAVSGMEKVTQQSAASSEQSSSAASELSSQSEQLAAMIGSFQLDAARHHLNDGSQQGAQPAKPGQLQWRVEAAEPSHSVSR